MSTLTATPDAAHVELETPLEETPAGAILVLDESDLADAAEALTRDFTIEPGVELPGFPTLKVGKSYTITIAHTLFVENDDQQVLQDDMVMSMEFPGVLGSTKSWRKNVYVKRRKKKSFRYTTTVRGVKPKKAGEFTLTGRTRWFGKSARESTKVKVEA